MTAGFDLDRVVTDWLVAEAPPRAPGRVLAAALEQVAGVGQERPLGGRRFDAWIGRSPRLRWAIVGALLALALLGAIAGAGALLRQTSPKLDLTPPADLPAFVLSSYDRMPELPPAAITWLDGSTRGRIYVDRSGAVRFEQFASADATKPDTYRILSGNSIGWLETVGSDKVWVVQHEAIGEDPRVFILAEIGSGRISFDGAGCDLTRNAGEAGNGTAATGWRYVGVESVGGRLAHRVTCGGGDLWLDIETRLILRERVPLLDGAGRAIPGQFRTLEVTEIAFGEQPAALFDLASPEGITSVPIEELDAFRCAHDAVCSALPPSALPTQGDHGVPGNDPPAGAGPEQTEQTDFGVASATPAATPSASTTPAPSVTAPSVTAPSADESTGPSAMKAALTWTKASLKEDWPAPVRTEPAGPATILPILNKTVYTDCPGDNCSARRESGQYVDPTGDTGSADFPWVDIDGVQFCGTSCIDHGLVSRLPVVDPTEQWMAYGVVFDTDRDGIADWRYGVDNMPLDGWRPGNGDWPHRAWRTNLHTGRTESAAGSPYGMVGKAFFDTFYPGRWSFGGDATGGGTVGTRFDVPFYVWASEIKDGRVVATDYAPDVGWLLPSPDAKP